MYAVVRTDKMYATDNRTGLVSVRYQPGGVKLSIENGSVVKLSELENNGTKEVYVGDTPTASDSLSDIVLIATPEVMYDETKIHLSDFCNEAGSICRGYRLHSKDVFSATKEAFVGEKPEVGKFVELTSDVKLNVVTDKTGSTLVGEIVDINKVGSYTYYAVEVCTVGAQAEGDLASVQEELDKAIAELEALKNKEVVWGESTITLSDYSKLTSVVIPDGVTSIGNYALGYFTSTGRYFASLKTVTVPDTVKSIGICAFGNSAITSFSSKNTTYINTAAFQDCKQMVTVELPNLVDCRLDDEIGATQFYRCTALQSVKMPKMRKLGTRMFDGTTSLKLVDMCSIDNQITSESNHPFKNSNSSTESALVLRSDKVSEYLYRASLMYVYVPSMLVNEYKTKHPAHADYIRPLEDYTVDGTVTGEFDESKI